MSILKPLALSLAAGAGAVVAVYALLTMQKNKRRRKHPAPITAPAPATPLRAKDGETLTVARGDQRDAVREAYAATARGSEACCVATPSAKSRADIGYSAAEMEFGDETGTDLVLGCGNPVSLAQLAPGEVVVDLGSGAGLDCLLAARKVGGGGLVIGVDMVPEMLARARAAAAKAGAEANVSFRLGEIEHLPVADASADAVISNCVINLSADKPQVVREAARVLRPGGRIAISDVIRTRELPERLQTEQALACWVAGAPRSEDLATMLSAAGFESVVVELKPQSASYIADWLPGSGAEKYVCAANITAVKPGGCAKGAKAGTSCAKKEAPKVAPQVAAAMACWN